MRCNKKVYWSLLLFCISMLGCPRPDYYLFMYETDSEWAAELEAALPPAYPDVQFAVASDLHLYNVSLGTEGEAFEDYLSEDRKMLVESEEILSEILDDIKLQSPQFLLLPGDLTKDGEEVNHELLATYLAGLEDAGIPVFVVPGNHDLNNPHAMQFDTEGATPVDYISPEEFKTIYAPYGFDEAIAIDTNSLSYVVEPVDGMWVICLDSTDTEYNIENDTPEVGGKFTDATLGWLETQLINATESGKSILAMMHHGVVPYWNGQEKLHPDYLVDDHARIAELFAAYQVRAVFTGHYHAQDVSRYTSAIGNDLYNVATGSLLTYPCPYRTVAIQSNLMDIASVELLSIPSQPNDFTSYAWQMGYDGVFNQAYNTVREDYGLAESDSINVAERLGLAFMAHYAGDEALGDTPNPLCVTDLSLIGAIIVQYQAYVFNGLWNDSEGSDNAITIDLASGTWE